MREKFVKDERINFFIRNYTKIFNRIRETDSEAN